MYKEYDWFLAEMEATGGMMSTEFATMNYVTIEELDKLEDYGIIERAMAGHYDFIFLPAKISEGQLISE